MTTNTWLNAAIWWWQFRAALAEFVAPASASDVGKDGGHPLSSDAGRSTAAPAT